MFYPRQSGAVSCRCALSHADCKRSLGSGGAAPTIADILAQAHLTGEAWWTENIAYNRLAAIPVANIGIDILGGTVID
jgi:hypothetical protein